jgi:hypothetical protein
MGFVGPALKARHPSSYVNNACALKAQTSEITTHEFNACLPKTAP